MEKLWIWFEDAEVTASSFVSQVAGTADITEQQFITYMSRKSDNNADEEELIKAFQVFDKDASGAISTAELRYVLCVLGLF